MAHTPTSDIEETNCLLAEEAPSGSGDAASASEDTSSVTPTKQKQPSRLGKIFKQPIYFFQNLVEQLLPQYRWIAALWGKGDHKDYSAVVKLLRHKHAYSSLTVGTLIFIPIAVAAVTVKLIFGKLLKLPQAWNRVAVTMRYDANKALRIWLKSLPLVGQLFQSPRYLKTATTQVKAELDHEQDKQLIDEVHQALLNLLQQVKAGKFNAVKGSFGAESALAGSMPKADRGKTYQRLLHFLGESNPQAQAIKTMDEALLNGQLEIEKPVRTEASSNTSQAEACQTTTVVTLTSHKHPYHPSGLNRHPVPNFDLTISLKNLGRCKLSYFHYTESMLNQGASQSGNIKANVLCTPIN